MTESTRSFLEDRQLTPDEASELLSIPKSTMEKMRVRGDGPPFCKIGGKHVRYPLGLLRAYIASRMVQSTSEVSAQRAAASLSSQKTVPASSRKNDAGLARTIGRPVGAPSRQRTKSARRT